MVIGHLEIAEGRQIDAIAELFGFTRPLGMTDVDFRARILGIVRGDASQAVWAPYVKAKPVCECGSEKAGTPGHSTWCPKHEND